MKHNQAVDEALSLLQAQTLDWGRPLQPEQLDLLRRYAELLASYTQANVIGSKKEPGIILQHLLDSLSCFSVREVALQGRLIDVGSGGGLPGIPLAIAQPELNVSLLEATEKKATFLQLAKEHLRLTRLNIINERAEDTGKEKGSRDKYDLAITRALASLPVVMEYSAPFVKSGGVILAMKGRLEEDEIAAGKRAAAKLGAEFQEVAKVPLRPELEQKQRHIAVFRKIASTPTGYPRRTGLAKKRPLGS